MKLVAPTTAQKADPLYQLDRLETTIRAADERGLKARWESGAKLRALRESDYDKTLEEIAQHLGVSRPELSFRMRFAESEEALVHAVNNGWSWHETRQRMTELVPRKRAPRTPKPVVAKEFKIFIRRVVKELSKAHASDLAERDFKILDKIQEEIARIYDEIA